MIMSLISRLPSEVAYSTQGTLLSTYIFDTRRQHSTQGPMAMRPSAGVTVLRPETETLHQGKTAGGEKEFRAAILLLRRAPCRSYA
jgi:hypothetical protein